MFCGNVFHHEGVIASAKMQNYFDKVFAGRPIGDWLTFAVASEPIHFSLWKSAMILVIDGNESALIHVGQALNVSFLFSIFCLGAVRN